jgi:hypothetical protein
MHDQPLQLDAGFDHMPRLSVSSWLHTIDSRVVSGEPIVIIDDGSTQRVVTAPCTGRIVDIYTEVGAHVLPRTVLGMVRPDLIMPEPKQGLGSILLGILMIGLAVIAIPIVTNVSPVSMPTPPSIPSLSDNNTAQPTIPETNPADEPALDNPMPDAPLPGASPNDDSTNPDAVASDPQTDTSAVEGVPDTAVDPNQLVEPTPSDPNAGTSSMPDTANTDIGNPPTDNPDNPDTANTDTGNPPTDNPDNPDTANTDTGNPPTDNPDNPDTSNQSTDNGTGDTQDQSDTTTSEPPASGFMSNIDITERFMFDVDRIITLTQEVERNLPTGIMPQSEYDSIVLPASDEVPQLIDTLSQIIFNNRDNPDINEENRRWFSSFTDAKDECLAIYATIKQSVQSKQAIPDLTSSFTGCYVLADNFSQ